MKFRDMENDSRYIMLNSKLKDTKKKIKSTMPKQKISKSRHIKNEKTSKFAEKYQDRIASIKQSDKKTQIKRDEKIKQKMNKENNKTIEQRKDNIQIQREIRKEKEKEKRKSIKRFINKKNAVKPKH